MKKLTKIILLLLALSLTLAVPFAVSASESEPSLKIEAANLSFEDSVYPVFAVSSKDVDASSIKLLVWTSPKTSESEYIKGTEAAELTSYADETIDGVPCKKFKYTKLYAKNMTDDIYVRAYAEVDGEAVYSDIVKYSVLKYAYNKLGYTGTATIDEDLKEMLEGMLVYGAGAQKYFGYKTDRLATAKFYKVSVEGGYLADGTSSGLYLEGDVITVTSSSGNREITVGTQNVVVDAVTGETSSPSEGGTEGLEYELQSNDTYAVVDYTGTATEVVIPSTYEGKAVTKIDSSAFYNVHHVTSISIPASVTYVNEQGFSYCQGLTALNVHPDNPSYKSQDGCLFSKDGKIIYVYPQGKTDESYSIPEGVEEIHYFAFYENLYIKSLSLPSTLTTLPDPDNGSFYYCTALSEFTVAAGNTSFKAIDGNLYSYDGKSLIKYAIGKADTTFSAPAGVTVIVPGAFDNASKLQSVILPEGVTEIGASAFRYCRSLSSIALPSTLTTINDSAFTETALTEVTIPASVTYIGYSAFGNCKKLGSIKFELTEGWSQQSSGSLYPLDTTVVSTPKKAAEELSYKYANAWVRQN